MPVYEFECPKCRAIYVRHQSSYDPIPTKCECGPWMILKISGAPVVYRGDGWAKTDRRKESR